MHTDHRTPTHILSPVPQCRRHRKLLRVTFVALTLLGLPMFGLAGFEETSPRPGMRINGTLSRRDLADIRRRVWHETWRGFPRFSVLSFRELEGEFHARYSERIMQIDVNADGTVKVETIVEVRGLFHNRKSWKTHTPLPVDYSYGFIYVFQKDQHAWHLVNRGDWIS
jgi:hypothetical protein